MTRVYIFSPIPYSSLHQRPQQLADQVAARGIPVTFVEPCGLSESPGRGNRILLSILFSSALIHLQALLWRISRHRFRNVRNGSGPGETGITILAMPLVLPHRWIDSGLLEKVNAAVFREFLERSLLGRMGSGERSVAIVENPFWGLVLKKGDFTQIAYDCLDEMLLFAGKGSLARYAEYERRLLDLADVTFVTAEKLEEGLRRYGARSPLVRIPNGVDYDWFQVRAGAPPPDDIAAIHGHVAGYIGVLRAWFDYDLIGSLAAALPEVSFVIVGPLDIRSKIAHLQRVPNIFWLGGRPYEDMPRYVQAFDVCLIPFLEGRISMTTNPVKVFEYFALGKPVVSSPLHELEAYAAAGLLRVASGKSQFASAIRASLAGPDAVLDGRRREVARRHSWKSLTDEMLSALQERVTG